MPANFKNDDILLTTVRQSVYTCPAATTALVFGSIASNVDATFKADHTLTVERQKVDTNIVPVVPELPIAFGGGPSLPFIVLTPGESLWAFADEDSVVHLNLNIVERT